MPIEYNIDSQCNTVFLRAWGHISSQEVQEHYRRLREDPEFQPDHNGLLDLTGVTSTDYHFRQMKKTLPDEPWGIQSRRAVIVSNPLIFGLTRTFILLSQSMHGNISIFRDKNKAASYLNLETPDKPNIKKQLS